MPEIESIRGLDAAPAAPEPAPEPERRAFPVRGTSFSDPDRPPAGLDGGGFFDPGRIGGAQAGGGDLVQIRGYVSGNFFVTQRSAIVAPASDEPQGFETLDPLPFFGGGSATLYVGAPVYGDVVYARMALEYLSVPQTTGSSLDILAPAQRLLLFESAALEVNPLAWTRRLKQPAPRWLSEGFKITAGAFIVPFGLEDEEHAAPVQWFAIRPQSMSLGRVYPGTWSDLGVALRWRPTFGGDARPGGPVRPIELDIAVVNSDPCTQTRFIDSLFTQAVTGVVPRCERVLREAERSDGSGDGGDQALPIDGGLFGLALDNNANKSVAVRLRLFPLPAIDVGGSFVTGRHPDGGGTIPPGGSTADLEQPRSWRAGAHVSVDADQLWASERVPLPALRAELVVGRDEAAAQDPAAPELTDRGVIGGYAQVAWPLFRRQRTRLPGLIVQYRIDWADPDTDVPGVRNGVSLSSQFGDAFVGDEATVAHAFGLRLPALPRFTLKSEYVLVREDGGALNQLANDVFVMQAVVDF
jgi:hypothetical protein